MIRRMLALIAMAVLISPVDAQEITVKPLGSIAPEAGTAGAPESRSPDSGGAALRLQQGIAVLRGLDKVTGFVETFEVAIGGSAEFGRLRVSAMACEGRESHEIPESAAFLQIRDPRSVNDGKPVFSGWMFASSPGLSAMDHARYDIWVLSCKTR